MKRELKFRAWDGRTMRYDVTGFEHGNGNEMAGVFLNGDYCHLTESESHVNHAEVMQYTGLKDFFDTEIYEGDIAFLDSQMRNYEIVWDYGAWKMKCEACYEWLCDYYEDVHIIGNIHQNPELLEQK